MGTASCPDSAVEVHHGTLPELYAYFISHPIEKLHESSQEHIDSVSAFRGGELQNAVELAREYGDILHRTMFLGLAEGRAHTAL